MSHTKNRSSILFKKLVSYDTGTVSFQYSNPSIRYSLTLFLDC